MNELGDGILTGGGVNGMGTMYGDTSGDAAGDAAGDTAGDATGDATGNAAKDTAGDAAGIPGIDRGPPICESTVLPPTDRSFLGTGGGASRWCKKSDKS